VSKITLLIKVEFVSYSKYLVNNLEFYFPCKQLVTVELLVNSLCNGAKRNKYFG